MIWNIVSDSSCDLRTSDFHSDRVLFHSVPLRIQVGNQEFVDNDDLVVPEMLRAMAAEKAASSSACPSPADFARAFEAGDCTVCFTISSNLSGTYNSAIMARDMVLEEHPEKRVCVIDSRATAGAMVLLIRRARELMEADETGDFDGICAQLRLYQAALRTCFTLENFDNLIKNGRMNKYAGLLAGKLGFWGIGIGTEEGTIQIKGKARGKKKAIAAIVDDIKERAGVAKTVLISHCHNRECAEMLAAAVRVKWANAEVRIMPTRGLCSYYAELGGLIVGFRDNV